MDELIPEDHLLRKIDSVIDFTKIYEIVSDLYCENNLSSNSFVKRQKHGVPPCRLTPT